MREFNLCADTEDTDDFRRLINNKIIESSLMFLRDAILNKEVMIDYEIIPGMEKNTKLLIKSIKFNKQF
jgi:hypothetical protein